MPMSDNSGAAGRPLSACQSEEAPTAPPIRPGIAVGSSPSGTLYASRPPRCAPLCPRRRPALVASRLRDHAHRADRAAPHPHCAHRTPPASPSLALRRQRGPGWQESRRMHPFFAECAKKAPSLAISARNACFSRSRWQDPRLMRPFPGAIGRFGMHGARILPSRPPFRVEGPEIMLGAKMLPALLGLSRRRFAGRGPANWPNGLCALRPGPGPLATCARHPRPVPPQTSGTVSPTQCGHKNGTPERGSH